MSLAIQPKNPDARIEEYPVGFWPAFCVETPVAQVLECEYIGEDRMRIRYEHEGYVGAWISEDEALKMHALLLDYVKTAEYLNHRYFADRKSQMERMLAFLPVCGGFRMAH